MLPKQYRLQDYLGVEKVKKEGRLFQSPFFGLLILEKSGQTTPRFCFIVSTKLSKKATERNRAKRVLSEAVHDLLPKIKSEFDLVFLGKKSSIGKTKTEIETELEKVFKKSGLMLVE